MALHLEENVSFKRKRDFPLGAAVELETLSADPYPTYAALRRSEPVTWLAGLDMWYVTRADLVHEILMNDTDFSTDSADSTIADTFGLNMLTSDGVLHAQYRKPFQPSFSARAIRENLQDAIGKAIEQLLSPFEPGSEVELRAEIASRLPVQTILLAFGLPVEDEPLLRQWYDDFERALANFTRDQGIRDRARISVAAFHDYIDLKIAEKLQIGDAETLLGRLVHEQMDNPDAALSNDALKRNMSIIFFGGISTVEALILNSIWALAQNDPIRARLCADAGLIDAVLDETMRWMSPVQSATRHVTRDMIFHGVELRNGDTINCMLGAANRDPAMFDRPDCFDIDRPNGASHLGFATGPHLCLGFRLAKVEARAAVLALLDRAPHLRLDMSASNAPAGYEFRQPSRLTLLLER